MSIVRAEANVAFVSIARPLAAVSWIVPELLTVNMRPAGAAALYARVIDLELETLMVMPVVTLPVSPSLRVCAVSVFDCRSKLVMVNAARE